MFLLPVLLLQFVTTIASAQAPKTDPFPSNSSIDTGEIRTVPISDIDRIRLNTERNRVPAPPNNSTQDGACLLPPLNLTSAPTISADQLKIPAKARKEYQEACTALRNKKTAEAEKHLRKAVREDPKYSAAWVTLGQVFAAEQRTDEARNACSQGSTANSTYVPAYLCLADIALRAHEWEEALKLSRHALDLDPSNDAVAYEYNAAANLNSHNLAEAEKSGLRAAEIDKNHREPRVHFVLAQIYEAKGDPANEAAQLLQYLEYADNPDNITTVKKYLTDLSHKASPAQPTQSCTNGCLSHQTQAALDSKAVDSAAPEIATVVPPSSRSWGPPDIDEAVPPTQTDAFCPLPTILNETSKRAEELVENLQRFSASEHIEHIELGKSGPPRTTSEEMNYVVQIEQNSAGYPSIREYRSGDAKIQSPPLGDTGTAAFAMIFHPPISEPSTFVARDQPRCRECQHGSSTSRKPRTRRRHSTRCASAVPCMCSDSRAAPGSPPIPTRFCALKRISCLPCRRSTCKRSTSPLPMRRWNFRSATLSYGCPKARLSIFDIAGGDTRGYTSSAGSNSFGWIPIKPIKQPIPLNNTPPQ